MAEKLCLSQLEIVVLCSQEDILPIRMMHMEFKHIEYFIETCNHKSISQAAESLYISQQALSRCIANMEAELGCTIFHRTVKGISLTEEGKYLYEQFQPLVLEFRNTLSQTVSYFDHKPKKLSFACAPLIFGVLGPELLLSFQEAYPKITLDMIELSDTDCDAYVCEDSRHFGMLAIPEDRHGERLDYILVKTLPLYLYVHKDHPLAKLDQVDFGMLKDEKFLMLDKKSYYRKVIYSHTKPYGYKPKPAFESADVNHICSLVNTGNGIFLATKNPAANVLFKNIVMVPFHDETLTYSIAFIFQDYDKLDVSSKKFIEYILEHVNGD